MTKRVNGKLMAAAMTHGDTVRIYRDPVTETMLECEAILVRPVLGSDVVRLLGNDVLVLWKVWFRKDGATRERMEHERRIRASI